MPLILPVEDKRPAVVFELVQIRFCQKGFSEGVLCDLWEKNDLMKGL